MRIPEGLESFAEGCLLGEGKVHAFKAKQSTHRQYAGIDVEVEYPNGERFWLTDAPLVGVYNNQNGSVFVFQEGNLRVALVGAAI